MSLIAFALLFVFIDTAPTVIYTLSLHDALPISAGRLRPVGSRRMRGRRAAWVSGRGRRIDHRARAAALGGTAGRSEEHTSELQSQSNLVCRLLLEEKQLMTRSENTH